MIKLYMYNTVFLNKDQRKLILQYITLYGIQEKKL